MSTMSSASKSPTPSPKNSPKIKSPPLLHTSSSESSTTVKVPSPLNRSVSPKRSTPLSSSSDTGGIEDRLLVHSIDRNPSPSRINALSRIVSVNSLRRGRSLSPHRGRATSPSRADDSHTPDPSESWWGSRELLARPWHEPPKRKKTIPPEQSERWEITRQRVASAAVSVLGTTGDVIHELLQTGVGFLGFVPVPGLGPAASTLLQIWDTLQQVDTNRLACLRLTERCADILLSIREEIQEAGNYVGIELEEPINRLVEAFTNVRALMQKQVDRPFIKRYLKRDDILRAIQVCDTELNNALSLFGLSIQIRILRQIQDSERQRQAEMADLISAMKGSIQPHTMTIEPTSTAPPVSLEVADSEFAFKGHVTSLNPRDVAALLQTCRARQNEQDIFHDMEDLRQIMRAALQAGSDADMIGVLQVSRHEMPEAIKTLQRALERQVEKERSPEATIEDVEVLSEEAEPLDLEGLSSSPTSGSLRSKLRTDSLASARARSSRDTLDREFLESGIDALRRMSKGSELSLPGWTITKWEVDREEKIGIGFFSDVYKGTWEEMVVAIKVLAPTAPRKLFVHEVEIWKTLLHPNVLKLYGASSTSAEPPWFFVSPYMKHGSLIKYLKNMGPHSPVNLLKMIYEVALGMAYLHERGVLHGDLKAPNVLVDDEVRCVISDFGQSEMKSEIRRISGNAPPHGTLRWQAPELMAGGNSQFLAPMDVYAFAICCIEILNKGSLPWPLLDDDTVRHLVLKENRRPDIPNHHPWTRELAQVIGLCWNLQPASRPEFSKVVVALEAIGKKYSVSLQHTSPDLERTPRPQRRSFDMCPSPPIIPLPDVEDSQESEIDPLLKPPHIDLSKWRNRPTIGSGHEDDLGSSSAGTASSLLDSSIDGGEYSYIRVDSPPPLDECLANTKDERRYRMLLQHEFHPSLTLPLWSPSTIEIGAVGYLRKPEGEFVTLFNAFDPPQTSNGVLRGMANLHGYGNVKQGNQRRDKRNRAQRALGVFQSWLSSKLDPDNINRRYSFHVMANHKIAFLCVESTMYKYIEDLSAPKKWFKANVDDILRAYTDNHLITKEDLFLVIGTLSAPDYALFVSHSHPDGQAHFEVFASPRHGHPWGRFTTSTDLTSSMVGGPHYQEDSKIPFTYKGKVSETSTDRWDSLLLARLRFRPDASEPSSL